MPNNESATLTNLMNQLETLWRDLDTLFGALTADEWLRPHGPGRIFADVPAYLANFDRDVVVAGLERGANVPWEQQQRPETPIEWSHWPTTQVGDAAHSILQARLGQMQSARHALRAAVATLSDADLARPIWLAIQDCGWVRLQDGLEACRWHTWSRYMETCWRLKRDAPASASDPAITYAALSFMLQFWLPCVIDRQAAIQIELRIEWTFTGPGGGQWTMNVAEGQAVVREGQAHNPDLAFTQSPETFVKTLHQLHDPMMAMLTGEIKVRGFDRMRDFDRLFPGLKSRAESGSMIEQ